MRQIFWLCLVLLISLIFLVFLYDETEEHESIERPKKLITTKCSSGKESFDEKKQPTIDRNTIAILFINDYEKRNDQEFDLARSTVICYAGVHGYHFELFDPLIPSISALFCLQREKPFQIPCIIANFLEAFTFEWVLYIGADIGVINPLYRLESLIPNQDVHLVFYSESDQNPISNQSFLAKNSPRSINFLRNWADFQLKRPDFPFVDLALPNVISSFFHPEMRSNQLICERILKTGRALDYTACMQEFIFWATTSTEYYVYAKEQGFIRNGSLTNNKWSLDDFLLSGWRKWKYETEWEYSLIIESFLVPCQSIHQIDQWKYNFSYVISPETKLKILEKHSMKELEEHRKIIKRLNSTKKLGNLFEISKNPFKFLLNNYTGNE
ncbi:unnamed protein product, partial [Mesorhabditis belari]|uniref:Glycosyltransferase n=1 Tax=Mesorhabditis belari TaxID=2138241 RepID=A0AAF3FH91_9BILA